MMEGPGHWRQYLDIWHWVLLLNLLLISYIVAEPNVFPVLYPAVSQADFMIEDQGSQMVLPAHGALPWFLCAEEGHSDKMESVSQPIPRCRDLILRTQQNHVNLTLSLVDNSGAQESFSENPQFQVLQGNKRPNPSNQSNPPDAPTVKFVVSLGLLKKDIPVLIHASVLGQTREIITIHDPDPPEASISHKMDMNATNPAARFMVRFNERVVPLGQSSGSQFCDAKLEPLSNTVTFLDMMSMSTACNSIGSDWAPSVELSGVKSGVAEYDIDSVALHVVAYPEAGAPSDIQFKVGKRVVMDYAGNLNEEPIVDVAYYRPTVHMPSSELRMRLLGRRVILPEPIEPPVNVAAAAALGSAATAAAAAAAATSAAASAAGGAGNSGSGNPIDILTFTQKLFLSGLMAVKEFPENYEAFTSQLNWAVFDVQTPWETAKKRSEELEKENATITAKGIEGEEEEEEEDGVGGQIKSIVSLLEQEEDDSPYDHLKRVFFWVPLGYALLMALHGSCLCCCLCKRRPIPDILQFPRLEIMFAFWAIPALAGASAALYRGKRVDALFATYLLILFPTSFMVWNVFMLYHHFYSRNPAQRKANMVLLATDPPKYTTREHMKEIGKRIIPKKPSPEVFEKRRNVWDKTGSDSPVGFVNPAFLDPYEPSYGSTSERSLQDMQSGIRGSPVILNDSHTAGKLPNRFHGFRNEWNKAVDHNIDAMIPKDRVNNALVIPSMTRGGDDSHSDDIDDPKVSSTGNSSITYGSPPSSVYSLHSARLNPPISSPESVEKRKDISTIPEVVEGGELRLSVITPDSPLKGVDLLVVQATQEEDQDSRCQGWREIDIDEKKIKEEGSDWNHKKCLVELCDLFMLSTFLGRRQEEGEWIATSKANSRFIARYGPLFEDHRGHPVVRREATYATDPRTGKVDRGLLVPVKQSALLRIPALRVPFTSLELLPAKKIYRFQLQILTRLLDFTKIIMLACLIEGLGNNEDSMRQVVALFVVSAINLVVVRIARPFPTRLDMTVAILAEGADVVTFFLGIVLLLGPSHDREFRINIGKGMLYAEGAAFLSTIIERLCLALAAFVGTHSLLRRQKMPKMANVVLEAIGRYEGYLERKYLDRWMVKALKRGLHGRPVRREELPMWYYLRTNFLKPLFTFTR